MKAVILVGGEGTRLRPLTCNIPKAVVPVLNRPFLEHLICYLKKHGIIDVILAMGYQPAPIKKCLGDGSKLGVRLTYSVEKAPLGTAGAVKYAGGLLDEAFVVFNGDIVTGIDLTAMIKRHQEVHPCVSIALTPVDNPTMYGVVETDARGMVKRFVEKPAPERVTTNMINAGIYILEPEILALIPPATRFMFEHNVFPQLIEAGKPVLGYPSGGYWIDIGTPEKYLKVNCDLLREWGDEIRFEGKRKIHPTSKLTGPLLIGDGCTIAEGACITGPSVLGAGCVIEKDATVEGSVLWDKVHIGKNAAVRQSIIASGSKINGGNITGCVLGENVTVGEENSLTPGSRVWTDGRIEPGVPLK